MNGMNITESVIQRFMHRVDYIVKTKMGKAIKNDSQKKQKTITSKNGIQ